MAATSIARLRFPLALSGAVVVSMVVFAFLHALISQRGELGEVQEATKIEFTRLRQDTEVERKKTIPLSPVVGVVAVAGGIVLLLVGGRRS